MKRVFDMLLERRARRLTQLISPYLPETGRILDLGSGTGHNARSLAMYTSAEIVEVDVTDLHVVGPGPVLFDGRLLPFAAGTFSASLVLFVLQYVPDPQTLLSEVRRVTHGRVLVVQSTCSGTVSSRFLRCWEFATGRLAFHVAQRLHLIPAADCALRPAQYFTPHGLDRLFCDAGFRVVDGRAFDRVFWLVRRRLYVLEANTP